jgi:hypothetical protein
MARHTTDEPTPELDRSSMAGHAQAGQPHGVPGQGRRSEAVAGDQSPLVRAHLKTPRAAAIAGILFSGLMICALWLLQASIPPDSLDSAWIPASAGRVSFALNLVPFAGIAFLWFVGVVRDRLGELEDRFFATVFLGSGLLFLGMMFVAAAAGGGLLLAHSAGKGVAFDPSTFAFARAFSYDIMHIYAFKMAAVFMFTTATLAFRTRFIARWIAILGYIAGAFLVGGSSYVDWAIFVFPTWVLLVSVSILRENLRSPRHGPAETSPPP